MPANAPFPVDAKLTAVTVGYSNRDYIADLVAPRAAVPAREFKWWEYPVAEGFGVTDDRVGRASRPNEVEFTAAEKSGIAADHGLDDPIPQEDIANGATMGRDVRTQATERLSDIIALNREIRAAALLFTAATYATGYKVQLSSSSDKWSDFTNSDPIDDIMTGLDACLIRPNIMVIGQTAWSKLRRNPKIAKAIHGTDGDEAIATRKAVADLFELQDVIVGQSRLNTAKKGQTASLSRVWGGHCSLIYRNPTFSFQSPDLTFAATAQWGDRVAGSAPDGNIGLRGGERVRVGESVRELVIAQAAGYFIEDAV